MDVVLSAVLLGLFAGLSPGPLMTVVVAASLERGFRAGVLTAIAPFLTDVPVILLSVLVLNRVPPGFLSAVTLVGGVFVGYVGVRTIQRSAVERPPLDIEAGSHRDVWRGALVNLLAPHPWLFWFTVGTPILVKSWAEARWQAVAFLVIFLGLLVGCKVGIAWAAARGRQSLDARWYRVVMTTCGVALVGFGGWLLWSGARSLLS